MTQLKVRKALKFGWLGAIIALLLTLFWPILEPIQVALNTAAGYAIAFAIRILRGLFEKSK
jgi:hypothetical protein